MVEAKKEDRADDDGREEDLTDVIVENFLIRTGSRAVMILLPVRNFG